MEHRRVQRLLDGVRRGLRDLLSSSARELARLLRQCADERTTLPPQRRECACIQVVLRLAQFTRQLERTAQSCRLFTREQVHDPRGEQRLAERTNLLRERGIRQLLGAGIARRGELLRRQCVQPGCDALE